MVDKEMAATATAIEDAVRRIEVTSGVQGLLWVLQEPWGLGWAERRLCKGQVASAAHSWEGGEVTPLSCLDPHPALHPHPCTPCPVSLRPPLLLSGFLAGVGMRGSACPARHPPASRALLPARSQLRHWCRT